MHHWTETYNGTANSEGEIECFSSTLHSLESDMWLSDEVLLGNLLGLEDMSPVKHILTLLG